MKVMVIVKATPESERGDTGNNEEMFRLMTEYNEKLVAAGIMKAGEGLHPSSKGKRVVFKGKGTRVVDGPFTESKELVAGFWIWEVKSMEEAVEWARKCPNPMPDSVESELELRQVHSADDLADMGFTPELREREEKLAKEIERQNAQATRH